MKFSERWLREWIDPGVDRATLAHQLTMAGLEVDAVDPVAPKFSHVVVGEVLKVEPHPDADKLRVCEVNVGQREPLTIVCGAANVAPGLRVPTALVGAELPNDLKITRAKLRGVESHGMLCSAKELGLAEQASGLMVLPEEVAAGTDIRDYLQLDDVTIEIGLTPNRGDCLSIRGIAREVAVANGSPLVEPEQANVVITNHDTLPISLEAAEACPRYVGRIIRDVSPKAQTPMWMKERLRRCGVRSVSAVVDVTNYVMLELGQPMHAFDLEKLYGGVKVRLAQAGEKLKLLDGREVELAPDVLVIADDRAPVAMAGIMGGDASAVSDDTHDIFLESAFFQPEAISGRPRRYGLNTDSSMRFERGVDPELAVKAMKRASELLLKIVGGKAGPLIEAKSSERVPERAAITLRSERVRRLLGIDIASKKITEMLSQLGMKVREQGKSWIVIPPSFRFDIGTEIDLIEEIGRIYGYTNIPPILPQAEMSTQLPSEGSLPQSRIQQLLVARGYQEAVTYSFVDPKLAALLKPGEPLISLMNPISAEMAVMRPDLWVGLLQTLLYNMNRQQSSCRIFEIGVKYSSQLNEFKEQQVVAGLLWGEAHPLQWGMARRAVDFFDAKADIEALMGLTGRQAEFIFESEVRHPSLHPGQAAVIKNKQGETIGWIGALNPNIQHQLGIEGAVFLFEIASSAITVRNLPRFAELSKYPSVNRDLAIVVDEDVTAQRVQQTIVAATGQYLANLELFDVYRGKGIESGRKSLALSLTLQDSAATLTDNKIEKVIEQVVQQLKQQLNASLRE